MLNRWIVGGCAAALSVGMLAPGASAGIQTETVDFFAEGEHSVTSMLLFLRPHLNGRRIVETRLTLEFTPAAGYDAGDFYVALVAPVSPDPGSDGFIFLNARDDLGFSGSDTQRVELTFSALNGLIFPGLWTFEAFPTFEPPIFVGTFSDDSRWEIDTRPVPAPAALALPVLAGIASLRRRR